MTFDAKRSGIGDPLLHLGLAVVGWALCGATMFAGMALSTMTVALIAHALLAPVFFGLGAWVYFRRRDARRTPLVFAAVNVAVVIALDIGVVALLIERSFEMFESVAGTWLPFASLFTSSWLVGAMTRARIREREEPGPEQRAVASFLSQKRIALVGLSTDPASFSRAVDARLRAAGYEVIPVHPSATEIEGRPCYARVQDVPERPGGVLVMTPAARCADVVRDSVEAGVRNVWLHRGVGPGALSDEALALCDEHDLVAVRGRCPLMFLSDAAGIHRGHAYLTKLSGTYPR